MMSKITLNDVVSLQNETTALNTINNNSAAIEEASNKLLYRDGTLPNNMLADFDMNGFRILNLPYPESDNEPARLKDIVLSGAGVGMPDGGETNQILTKVSDEDYAAEWKDLGDISSPVTSVFGRQGDIVAQTGDYTKAQVGLGNVDNTSDLNKPISTATQTALNLKANTSSLAIVATSGSYSDLINKPFTVPVGGTTGQVLSKNSNTDGDTTWVNQSGGGSGSSNYINPEDYGMSTSASGAVNKAALEAALAAGAVMLPKKSYVVDALTFPNSCILLGQGVLSKLVSTSTGVGIHLPMSTGNGGMILKDFCLTNQGSGTHGIHFELTGSNGYMSNWIISGLYVDGYATNAIYFDNTIGNANGFFTGILQECSLVAGSTAGIRGVKIGDSNIFRKNVITAGSAAGTGQAIWLSQVPGARQIVIEDNNLTTLGGAVLLQSCSQTFVFRNWAEVPSYIGDFNGSVADALITFIDCFNCYCQYNTLNGGHGATGPSGTLVGANYGVNLAGTTNRSKVQETWFGATSFNVSPTIDSSSGSATNVIANNIVT